MAEFGFGAMGLRAEDFLDPEVIIEIGREPVKIQVLTGIDGVAFDQCYAHRVVFADNGLVAPFISFEDLLANKAASPRPKVKLDLEELRRVRDGDREAGSGSADLTQSR